eukprot:scaffold2149_cov406-Prasinococcus_capsulatus_cf.AAC.3
MQQSIFCPVAPGDSNSSKRLFSAIASLCIPVIICDRLDLPFQLSVDWASFSVRIPEADFLANPQRLLALLKARHASMWSGGWLESPETRNNSEKLAAMRKALLSSRDMLLWQPRLDESGACAGAGAAVGSELRFMTAHNYTSYECAHDSHWHGRMHS